MSRGPSLLQPGQVAAALPRWDLVLLAATYLVTVAARWSLRDVHPYTAEATHFVVAKGLWDSTTNIRYVDFIGGYDDYSWFFWQRPLLSLPFWPAAQHSFGAYRVTHLLLVAAAPALGAWLLRLLGVGPLPAYGAALALAVHPLLLPWTVLVLPDSLVLTLTLAALLLAHHGRPAATALTLLAASWVKEVAFVTSLTLLVLALWRDADGRRASLRPLHVGRFARWLAPVVPLAFLPLWVSMQVPGAVFPGFRPGGDVALMYEALWMCIWFAPVPLLALLSPRTRRFALVALAWPAFFLAYHYGRDKAIESWYNVLPATFTLLAVAAGISTLWQARGRARWAAPAIALAVACLLSVQVLVPDSHPLNAGLVTPLSHRGQWDYAQARANELARDDDLAAVLQVPGPGERGTWVVLDVDWSLIMHPVAANADEVVKIYSVHGPEPWRREDVEGWGQALQTHVDATVVYARPDIAINVATRAAYADCGTAVGNYMVIPAQACQGHGGGIWEEYQRARAAGAE